MTFERKMIRKIFGPTGGLKLIKK